VRAALIGWLVILAAAVVWEAVGLAGVDGVWPLTWLIRDALHANEDVASLVLILSIVGFPAWLVYHLLVQRRRYGR
jgi:hypothetical protein